MFSRLQPLEYYGEGVAAKTTIRLANEAAAEKRAELPASRPLEAIQALASRLCVLEGLQERDSQAMDRLIASAQQLIAEKLHAYFKSERSTLQEALQDAVKQCNE